MARKFLIIWTVKGTYLRKRRWSKIWTVKWQQTQQLSTTEPKKQKQTKQRLEQEQNHRNRDHMEGYQWGEEEERMVGKRYRE